MREPDNKCEEHKKSGYPEQEVRDGRTSIEVGNAHGAKGRRYSEERKGETVSTLSLGGSTWLNKLDRIGKLASRDTESTFNNLCHIIDGEFLADCARCLDGSKAPGIDGVKKENYLANLNSNIATLLQTIRRGIYQPKPSRLVEIPKADGSTRPLSVACFEDKVVQAAVSRILTAIYEPTFLDCSFGYRPRRNAHDAIRRLLSNVRPNRNGAIVEIDLRKYFCSVPRSPLMEMLSKKIKDRRFLGLVNKLVHAETLGISSPSGVPQGSIISPILSNIYLHEAIDRWVADLDRDYFKGRCEVVRFCDDMVFTFEIRSEAESFYRTLPKRLSKFGLTMHTEKSSIQRSGLYAVRDLWRRGAKPGKFKFLGFEFSWIRSRKGLPRLRAKSQSTRLVETLRRTRQFLWRHRNAPNHMVVLRKVKQVLSGWVNYHAVSDNSRSVHYFVMCIRRLIYQWFNSRGHKGTMSWKKLQPILNVLGIHAKVRLQPLYSLGS